MKILWAVRIENEDWQAELITEVEDRIPAASEWARANGFNRLRVATIDDNANPTEMFIKAVRLPRRRPRLNP